MFGKKCGAKARTNNYQPCRQPAMANGRCRLHGGKSTGAKTKEGQLRSKNASWRHGMASKEALEEKKAFRNLLKQYKSTLLT